MELREKLRQLAEERARVERAEAGLMEEARNELDVVTVEIARLEERRAELEVFLGLDKNEGRAEHGQIQRLCLAKLSSSGRPMGSGEIKEELEQENPGMKLSSVPSTLSRLTTQGRVHRDESGRYSLIL